MNSLTAKNGTVIREGEEFQDSREDNVRTLRVERFNGPQVVAIVIAQTYQGETTYPDRETRMDVNRLAGRAFKCTKSLAPDTGEVAGA
ncbi:hypothetical protein ACWIGW_44405 [Nocardia brasiliensis]